MIRIRRRRFLKLIAGSAAVRFPAVAAPAEAPPKRFVAATQFTPIPSGKGWKDQKPPLDDALLRDTVENILQHGFNALEYPIDLPAENAQYVVQYAGSRGMVLVWQAGEMELFGRDAPPAISMFSPEYPKAARKKVEEALRKFPAGAQVYSAFCYQDEPFHAGAQSFDYGVDVRREFKRRYGYELPPNLESIRDDPKKWLDVLNFRSDSFPFAWRQVYRIIKQLNPNFRVVLTHDSHSAFGAGVGSNAKLGMDDVFHWGGDFADMFVFDIYPYMMYDFRYGECGRIRQPRISQLHYAFGQMRNLTSTYGKDLGFWVGTYNRRWFRRFMGPERQSTVWAEREISYTAVAQGADFLLTGVNIPEDARHWDLFGEGLRVLQSSGAELARAPKIKANACFLFPRTQYLQLQEEYWNVGLSYELFLRSFGELDILHEDQVHDSSLNGYKLLVLADVKLLPREVASHITRFVRDGGVVVADCVPNLDAHKNRMDILEALFGVEHAETARVRRTGVWEPRLPEPRWFIPTDSGGEEANPPRDRIDGMAFDRRVALYVVSPRPAQITTGEVILRTKSSVPALVHRRDGKGQVFLLGFCLQDTYLQTYKEPDAESRQQLHVLLHAITERAGVQSHVYSSNPGIEAAVRTNGDAGFLFAINHEAATPRTTVRISGLPFEIGRVTDVATSHRIDFKKDPRGILIEVEAPREMPRLFRLTRGSA